MFAIVFPAIFTGVPVALTEYFEYSLMIKEAYEDGAFENLNGHDPFGKLRGEKNSLNEAGTRVPLLFSWPNRVEKAFVQEQPFIYLDMLATFSGLLNISIEIDDYNDSKDGAALFLQKNAPYYREYIMTQNNGGDKAIRQGNWKFYPAKMGDGQNYTI